MSIGPTEYQRGYADAMAQVVNDPGLFEIAEALCAADSILSLLRYRGIVDSDHNREDVAAASAKLEALRSWYEPVVSLANPT